MTSIVDGSSFVPLVPYNGTTPTGGDSETNDLNVFYQVFDNPLLESFGSKTDSLF